MKESQVIKYDFITTMKNALENSMNFENHTEFTPYEYISDTEVMKSFLGLCESKNYILENILPHLKEKSKMIEFNEEERLIYTGNPMKLSYDQYGLIDYWWLIMAVNGYFNPDDFRDFKTLIIPYKEEIAQILDKEVFANPYFSDKK